MLFFIFQITPFIFAVAKVIIFLEIRQLLTEFVIFEILDGFNINGNDIGYRTRHIAGLDDSFICADRTETVTGHSCDHVTFSAGGVAK